MTINRGAQTANQMISRHLSQSASFKLHSSRCMYVGLPSDSQVYTSTIGVAYKTHRKSVQLIKTIFSHGGGANSPNGVTKLMLGYNVPPRNFFQSGQVLETSLQLCHPLLANSLFCNLGCLPGNAPQCPCPVFANQYTS